VLATPIHAIAKPPTVGQIIKVNCITLSILHLV
jgi:hypothetical protein